MEKKLIIKNTNELDFIRPNDKAAAGSMLAKAIGDKEGWDDYVMRIVRIESNGTSFNHNHSWPHINYYIKGEGVLQMEGVDYRVSSGDCSYVPGGHMHQWRNETNEIFEFICIVPKEGHNI